MSRPYPRYGFGNSDPVSSPPKDHLSPTRAIGLCDVLRLAWEALPLWARWTSAAVGYVAVFGLSAFCLIAVMELWPGGAR